jgi:hypothetical protein
MLAALLEVALPVASSTGGVLTLQVESVSVADGISSKAHDAIHALGTRIEGLKRIVVKTAAEGGASAPAERMTVEKLKSSTLAALRKSNPVLGAAIETLDLDLVD